MTLEAEVRAAYDGADWSAGPERVYAVLAALLLDHCPVPLRDALLLDAGAGTGAVSSVARERGAIPVALDLSLPMLSSCRGPRVAGSVGAQPFRASTFDVVAAGFCLNHVADVTGALGEMRRVVRSGGAVLASVFAAGEDHPAKAVVDSALAGLGWRRPDWHVRIKRDAVADPETLAGHARAAGLAEVTATLAAPGQSVTDPVEIVRWRLGLAHTAAFVAALPPGTRAALVARLVTDVAALGAPLAPQVVVLSSVRA